MNLYTECKINKKISIHSFFTAFEARFDSGYFFAGEAHDFWEMVYVKSGSVGIVAGDNIFRLTSGQLILHPPMEFHRIWSVGDELPEVTVISFGAEWNGLPEKYVFSLNESEKKLVSEAMELIRQSFLINKRSVLIPVPEKSADAQLAASRLEELFLYAAASDVESNPEREIFSSKYAEIIRVLSENTDKEMTIDEIAQLCNMSPSSLKKVFSRYSGMGVKRYFNEMKIRLAAQYLADGLSVKETAALLGFADQNYFSAFFKNMTGQSPTGKTRLQKQKREG